MYSVLAAGDVRSAPSVISIAILVMNRISSEEKVCWNEALLYITSRGEKLRVRGKPVYIGSGGTGAIHT